MFVRKRLVVVEHDCEHKVKKRQTMLGIVLRKQKLNSARLFLGYKPKTGPNNFRPIFQPLHEENVQPKPKQQTPSAPPQII